MDLSASLQTALRALMTHRLRTTLAVLGIVIGVGAVIALMGVGKGQQKFITSRIQSLGTNLLFVRPGSSFGSATRVRGAVGSAPTLTYDDALAIGREVPHVVRVAPEWGTFSQVIAGDTNLNTRVMGVTPEYFEVRNLRLRDGDLFAEREISSRSMVAVLGANAAQNLFGEGDPLGQIVRVSTRRHTLAVRVMGVLESVGGTGLGSLDENLYMPLTTMQARLASQRATRGVPNVSNINVEVVSQQLVPEAQAAIDQLLRERHRVSEPDFVIISQADIMSTLKSVTDAMTIFLSSIAAISLLVGGIGIMNIMLVSVTERTREIGIRKALGARRRDILLQFLVEALMVSLAGGLLGILLGVGLTQAMARLTISGRPLYAVVAPEAIVLAFVVSAAIGIFFGLYPAVRAARLNPVDALRYE